MPHIEGYSDIGVFLHEATRVDMDSIYFYNIDFVNQVEKIFIKYSPRINLFFINWNLLCYMLLIAYLASALYAAIIMVLQMMYIRSASKIMESNGSKKIKLTYFPKITIQIPVREEPLDIIKRILLLCSKLKYPKDKLEVILVSDDSEEMAIRIKKIVKEITTKTGLKIIFLHRKDRKGFKAGALNYALKFSSGEYIVVFDVDTVFKEDFLERVIPYVLNGYDAVVVRWTAGNADLTPTSRALSFVFDVMAEIVQNGRAKWSGTPALVGSGCILSREIIEKVGGWNEKSIAEDSDMGLRIILAGGKIKFIDDARILVEVPYNYASFKKQQIRWIYGSVEMLRRYALRIISCNNLNLKQKIDNLLYYGQYLSIILNIVAIAFTTLFIIFRFPFIKTLIFVQTFLFIMLIFYACGLFKLIKKMKYGIREILPYLGRVTAMGLAVSLPGLLAFLKAVFNMGLYWEVTPKGLQGFSFKSSKVQEFVFGLTLIFMGLLALSGGYSLLGVYLILNSSAFIYVALRRNL